MNPDIETIKQRLKDYFLSMETIGDGAKVKVCRISQAGDYVPLLQPDGSFADVDYYCTASAANGVDWEPYLALDRIQMMAIAYHKPGHPCYCRPEVLGGVERALLHWKTIHANPEKPEEEGCWSVNWWEREIGIQLRFARIGLFVGEQLSPEALRVILSKLNAAGSKGAGQNALWSTQNALYRALILGDDVALKTVVNDCLAVNLRIQTTGQAEEAVQVDYSAHCHGELFYSNGYGMALFRDMAFWMEMLRDTAFALPERVAELMSDYMLRGTRWTIRQDLLEIAQGYIMYWDTSYAHTYVRPLRSLIAMDAPRSQELRKVLDNIEGRRPDNGLSGNHYMWTSAYMGHMRPEYGVNIRMDSHLVKGAEWRATWPEEAYGNLVFWTTAAACTVAVTGDEYRTVYPAYDWRHVPGVTAPFALSRQYGADKDRDFCMGLSDGTYGSTAFVYQKNDGQGTTGGTVGYFLFNEEIVALGTGIFSDSPAPVHTTVNQTKAVRPLADGKPVSVGTKDQAVTGRSVHNNGVGYVFLSDTVYHVEHSLHQKGEYPSLWDSGYTQFNTDSGAERSTEHPLEPSFSLWVDHGTTPRDASYAYVMLPMATAEDTAAYAEHSSIAVLANTKALQAVYHTQRHILMANFYQPGSVLCPSGEHIAVDNACSLMLRETSDGPLLSVAVAHEGAGVTRTVTMTTQGQPYDWHFAFPEAPYTGQTITKGRQNL